MTYIDYLNGFHHWLESNSLPGNAQLLYFKLLHLFNRAGWPESVQLDNLRLMSLMDAESRPTATRARDRLVRAGFISFERGRKGSPNRYRLSRNRAENLPENVPVSVPENVPVSVPKNVPKNVPENVPHNKTKTKTKKASPLPPLPDFGPELQRAFLDWLDYKREKNQAYKPTGLKALAAQVKSHAERYGEAAVAELIRACMASNWQGIIFDRLKAATPEKEAERFDDYYR